MPKEKELERLIPKIYRRKYEDIAMLFHVRGQRMLVPAVTLEKAIFNYFRDIGEENFNIESAITIYTRLQKEFYENTKEDKRDN